MATERQRIGQYELAEELGSGGMGTVYRAMDTRTGQTVALKVMDSRLAKDPDYVRRFQREADIAKKLDSPHIVRVLESGQDDNHYFLVMEYVEGKNLTEVLRERGKLPPEEARSIATQVALALEAGHEQGVVHRDIKPGNILIDRDGTAKVTDFGIARAADSTTITKTGLFLGTLSYAAPELLAGKADIRSDIYSLGVVLYQMLAGRVPFESDTPLALMDMHRSQEPPTLESLGVRVPADLRAIVERCLAKRPEDRYQQPSELTAELEGRSLAAALVPASGVAGQVPPSGPSGSVLAEWFKSGGSRYTLAGVGVAGVVLAAVIVAVAATNGGRGESGKEVIAATATSRPAPTSTQPPARPTTVPTARVTNRQNCDAIRGTDYLSTEERDWFLRKCEGILVSQNFEDPASSTFASTNDSRSRTYYSDGEYCIEDLAPVGQSGGVAFLVYPYKIGDATVAVDARIVGNADTARVMMFCRTASIPRRDDAGYRIDVDFDTRSFIIERQDAQRFVDLVGWQPSAAIRGAYDTNRIQFSCAGGKISASINGAEVATVQDQTYAAGYMYIATYGQGRPHAGCFDNLLVTIP